jgi:hypothetical protein
VKVTRIGPADEIFHRFLIPKWAHLPTSGAGAATDGGRFNRPGIEALYLSRPPDGSRGISSSGLDHAAGNAANTVRLDPIIDLSEGFDPLVWDSNGLNGTANGERSPGSTGKHQHPGDCRISPSRPDARGFSFHPSSMPEEQTSSSSAQTLMPAIA